jgi:hypothetical protein
MHAVSCGVIHKLPTYLLHHHIHNENKGYDMYEMVRDSKQPTKLWQVTNNSGFTKTSWLQGWIIHTQTQLFVLIEVEEKHMVATKFKVDSDNDTIAWDFSLPTESWELVLVLNCWSGRWGMIASTKSPSEASTVPTPPAAKSSATIVPFSFSRFQELVYAHRLQTTKNNPRLVIIMY